MTSYSYDCSAYTSNEMKYFVICELYREAIFYFNKIERIKLFKEYRKIILADVMDDIRLGDTHCHIIEVSLLDDIKLTICFENIMKAKVLLNGFLPHIIKLSTEGKQNPKLKELRNSQKNGNPILIEDFMNENEFIETENARLDLPNLSKFTINFSTLTKEHYQEIINVPENILKFIKKANIKRNTLHFRPSTLMVTGQKEIEFWSEILDYLNSDVIDEYNSLLSKQKSNLFPIDRITLP